MINCSNVMYFYNINKIGGIESYLYYIAKKYHTRDITLLYRTGDVNQLKRLRKYIRCIRIDGSTKITCDKAFFNLNCNDIDLIDAKEYYFVAHGDYKDMVARGQMQLHQIWLPKQINNWLGVSKIVCDGGKEILKKDFQLCYNPIDIDKPQKVLNLISPTRLTKEKGKGRIEIVAHTFNKHLIPIMWSIFTDDKNELIIDNLVYMKPRLNITDYIANSDALVQLSDNEGYCYSVVEALCLGVPVIVTDCPVFRELGVIDGVNGIIIKHDLSNLDVERIYREIPKMKNNFKYEPPKDIWDKLLTKNKSTYNYEEEVNKYYEVEVIKKFNDKIVGERFLCKFEELDKYLLYSENGIVKPLIKIIKEED